MANLPDGQEPMAMGEISGIDFDPLNEDEMRARGFIKEATGEGGYVWKLANSSFRHLENIIERNKAKEGNSN